MTRSWLADPSLLELVPDHGPDGPGALPELPLAVGLWSSTGAGSARVVDAEPDTPNAGAAEAGKRPSWVLDTFPLVCIPDQTAAAFSRFQVALTAVPGHPEGAFDPNAARLATSPTVAESAAAPWR